MDWGLNNALCLTSEDDNEEFSFDLQTAGPHFGSSSTMLETRFPSKMVCVCPNHATGLCRLHSEPTCCCDAFSCVSQILNCESEVSADSEGTKQNGIKNSFLITVSQSNALFCTERSDFWSWIIEHRSDNNMGTNFSIVSASKGLT